MLIKPSVIGLNLAAATSVANVFTDVCRKKALSRNNLISASFWIRLASAAVLLFAFFLRLHDMHGPLIHDSGAAIVILGWQVPVLLKYLLLLFFDTGLIAVVVYLYFGALQESDLSLCIPFLSFTPVLLIPSGYLFLHESPSERQLLGVLLVVGGSLLMNRDAFRFGLLGPVRAIVHQKGSRNILLCAVIYAISNPVDKRLVLMSDSVTYAMCYGVMICLIYAALVPRLGDGWQASLRIAPFWICAAGILDASELMLQFTTHNYIDVFITITVKRAGVILSVFAGWLIFREKHIEDRLVASTTMLGGVILIYMPLSPAAQAMLVSAIVLFVFVWLRTHPIRPEPENPQGIPSEVTSPPASHGT